MLNPSARNSRFNLSRRGNVLLTTASRFHIPGPRKALRPVMFDGKGPQSEIPFGKSVRSGMVGSVLSGGNRFELPHEFAAGRVPIGYELVPPPVTPLGIDLNVRRVSELAVV